MFKMRQATQLLTRSPSLAPPALGLARSCYARERGREEGRRSGERGYVNECERRVSVTKGLKGEMVWERMTECIYHDLSVFE
jgi:hypothetical protein